MGNTGQIVPDTTRSKSAPRSGADIDAQLERVNAPDRHAAPIGTGYGVALVDGRLSTNERSAGGKQQVHAVTSMPPKEPTPIWRWAETNQGLLSLLALVVALAFGFFEWRANRRVGMRQRREYITTVKGVIDEILKFTTALRVKLDAGEPFSTCVVEWRRMIIAPRFMVDTLRGHAPGDALLAIEVNRLWTSLQMDDHALDDGSHMTRLADMVTNLQTSTAAISARW